MVKNLANLVDVLPYAEKQADEYCEAYARAHRDDKLQYLIGSGNLWGPTYSYAMCIMEEMQWMRTKSVTAGDFFHGTLEVIERDDTVLLFFGEDETRPQMERVEKFLKTICNNVYKFDTASLPLPNVDPKFRGPGSLRWLCTALPAGSRPTRRMPASIHWQSEDTTASCPINVPKGPRSIRGPSFLCFSRQYFAVPSKSVDGGAGI